MTGRLVELEPGLRRLLAPNPSPMTFKGTNTYLLGRDALCVIDPGPEDMAQLDAILAAADGVPITHILVTHAHVDHSPLARPLSNHTGAPVCAFGPATAGRREIMESLAQGGLAGGGEGIDADFTPDIVLEDGARIDGDGWSLRALHTPGHLSNHLSFLWGDAVFTGDHVMGWASSLVSPPDGDLTAFMASCKRLQTVPARIYYPGHGDPVADPEARLDWLIAHRESREAQILAALDTGPATAQRLAQTIYTDTPVALLPAAARNVLAHLINLTERDLATPQGTLAAKAVFERTP